MPRGGPKRTEPALVHISHSPGRPRKAAVGQTPPRKVPARFVVGRRFALTPAWGRHCGSVWPGKLASAGGGQRRAPGQPPGQGGKRRSAAAASQRPLSRGGGGRDPASSGIRREFPATPFVLGAPRAACRGRTQLRCGEARWCRARTGWGPAGRPRGCSGSWCCCCCCRGRRFEPRRSLPATEPSTCTSCWTNLGV